MLTHPPHFDVRCSGLDVRCSPFLLRSFLSLSSASLHVIRPLPHSRFFFPLPFVFPPPFAAFFPRFTTFFSGTFSPAPLLIPSQISFRSASSSPTNATVSRTCSNRRTNRL